MQEISSTLWYTIFTEVYPMIMTLDIGGTKTLWTIWQNAEAIENGTVPTNTINDFTKFIKMQTDAFAGTHPDADKITHLAFALAGPVTDNKLQLTNTGQVIDINNIRNSFPDIEVIFLNDLEALAHSISHLDSPEQISLFRSAANAKAQTSGTPKVSEPAGAKAVLSLGTGLGVAAVSREGFVIPSEGGHIDFAPIGETQQMIFDKLSEKYDHVSYERLLSGQGLANIYECITNKSLTPAQITEAAKAGNDDALQTFHIFTEILAAACGNYALTYMATGGIYIGGGMIPKILTLIDKEAFENAFLNKGRFKGFLDNISVYMILDETAPSIGAMSYR